MAVNRLEIELTANDRATKQLNRVQKDLKGFASSFKKNFLAITASITASIFAIKKAFDLIKLAATFKQQEEAFRNLAQSMGADADKMVASLKDLSANTLSTSQVMQNASRAMVLGLAPDKLPRLMEISRAAARAFGQDISFMFDSIVLGIGRQSRMILDNLGIIVSSEKAYADYAVVLGKTVKELTDTEKRAAFLNAVLVAGEDIIRKVNIQQKSQLENLQSLSAFWEDLKVKVGNALLFMIQGISVFVNVLRSGMATTLNAISQAFSFLIEKMAVAVEFIDRMADKIPGVNFSLTGMSEALRETSLIAEDFGNGLQDGAEDFALAAIQISNLMTNTVAPSVNLGLLNIEQLKESIAETGKEVKITGDKISGALGQAFASTLVQGQKFSTAMANAFKSWASSAVVEITKVILKLTILKNLMESISGGGGGFFGKILGAILAHGGEVGPGGSRKALPSAESGATIARGKAVPIIAHEGEIVGTPARLRQAGFGGAEITINIIEPQITGSEDIVGLSEELGFQVERAIKSARGVI